MAEKEKEITLSISINLVNSVDSEKNCVISKAIRKFRVGDTWFDVFDSVVESSCKTDQFAEDLWDGRSFEKSATVKVSSSTNEEEVFNASPFDQISVLHEFDKKLKYVTINIKSDEKKDTFTHASTSKENVFTKMMTDRQKTKPASKLSVDKPRFTAKDRLYNAIIDEMAVDGAEFPVTMSSEMVSREMMVLTDSLWLIDGNHTKIDKRASVQIPQRFEKFSGYNDYKKKRKAAPTLNSVDLKRHAGLLMHVSSSRCSQSWGQFRRDLETLASSLDSYASYLDTANEQQKYRQSLTTPVRPCGTHASVEYRASCKGPIKPCYSTLNQVLTEISEYEAVYFDENIHVDQQFKFKNLMQKKRFVQDLALSFDIDILTYAPGASLGMTVFIWRVPADRSPVEMMSNATKMHKKVESRLGEYHTREMKKEFSRKFQGLVSIPPHVLRAIYSDMTLDLSVNQNPALDSRLQQAIINDDPDLAVDLRSLNKGRPDDTFEVFFSELEKEVESLTAADERRHNIEHFSKYISVRDLIQQITEKCPEGTPIPSESTVLFAFVPKNSFVNSAKLYKGRIKLQHKVQTRQLRASHQDEHYCAAIFSYLKRYAVKYHEETTLVCLDDKSKIDFGEPGVAIASGVRGKKSLVPVTSVLGALDHDVSSKGSLTPSVCLVVDIPEEINSSFYAGQVHVTLKDSVFQPSSPFRHAKELASVLMPTDDKPNPFLLMYTDGGPDHRTTYGAVKLSLIILFKCLDLDLLIAARTAPGHSWANPAERIMSLLNLAYQNVSLHRDEMSSGFEQMLKSCGSMADTRKKAAKEDGLRDAWIKSLESMVEMLDNRTNRVTLKGKNFKTGVPASDESVHEFESQIRQCVDPNLQIGKYTMADLKKLDQYHRFMEAHCRERNYIFQVRKCDDRLCCTEVRNTSGVVPHYLPDPMLCSDDKSHYRQFEDVLGTDTNESHMPSRSNETVAKVAEQQQGCQNKFLVGQNARGVVCCYECQKPRCIYSKKTLTTREDRALKRIKEKYNYSCGSLVIPDGDGLHGTVFVRLQLCCSTPVEFAYYASTHIAADKNICCYCATPEATERDTESLEKFRVVLPRCQNCKKTKPVIKRLPKK